MEPRAKTLIRGHVPALDGVRGIAIVLVLLVHLTPWKQPYHGWRELLLSTADVGWMGVDLFFALSAFLITNILIDTRGGNHYFRDFYVRRILRIFPLYYLVVAVECLLLPHILGVHDRNTSLALGQQWALWTYTSNWVRDVYDGGWLSLGHLWSLSMEEQFYLVWAMVVAVVPPKRLGWAIATISAVVLATQSWLLVGRIQYASGAIMIYPENVCRFDSFIAGSAIAILLRHRTLPRPRLILGTIAIVTGLVLFQSVRRNMLAPAVQPGTSTLFVTIKLIAFPLLAIFFASIVGLAALPEAVWWRRIVSIKPLQFLGKYSYGIYVVHGCLLPLFRRYVPQRFAFAIGRTPNTASMVYCVIASSISVIVALATYYAIERPFLKLKRYFGGERPQTHLTS